MTDPYAVLGLAPGADDGTVRRQYLKLVRQFPPEREPARFAEIHAAYEQLRDPERRLERMLFGPDSTDSIQRIIADIQSRLRGNRHRVSDLLELAEE